MLVASLGVAIAVIAAYAWSQRSGDGEVDARLTDAGAVITFPDDGLGNEVVTGEALPEMVVFDGAGNEVSTTDLVGAPMVVNLWYSTCAPCATELPEFATVDAETDDVQFVGINPADSPEVMDRFAADRGVDYPLYRDDGYRFVDELGVVAFPVTLFVTSDGTIVEQVGALDADELRSKIGDLLQVDQATS